VIAVKINPLPPLSEEEFERLLVDIEANGQLDPIEVCAHCDGILDGWHRQRVCDELGIEPAVRSVAGVTTEAEHLAYAIRRNSSRGHRDPKLVRELRQQAYMELRDEGRTQQECSGLLGVAQPTLSGWEKARTMPIIGSDIGHSAADQRRVLSTADEVAVLTSVLLDGETQTSVADRFGVTQSTISKLVDRRRVEFLSERMALPAKVGRCQVVQGEAEVAVGDADLAFFSPPYNVGINYADDGTDDGLPDDEWQQLIADTMVHLASIWGVGRIVVNVPAALDRNPYRPIHLPDVEGLELEAQIVWDKGTTGNRTSWGSWRQPTEPRLRDRTERLYVYRTGNPIVPSGLVDDDGKKVSPLVSSKDFTMLTQDLWTVSPENAGRIGHPAPFPVELARRVIQLYGWPGCTVVDPFGGSGTTAVAAVELGCAAVVIDRSETYCRLALKRILEATS